MNTYNCRYVYRRKMTLEEAKKAGFGKVNEYTFFDTGDSTKFKSDVPPSQEKIAMKARLELKNKGIEEFEIITVYHPEKIY